MTRDEQRLREHFAHYKLEVQQAEEAQRRTDDAVVSALQGIRAHIHNRNYGIAEDRLEALLKVLPHDFGAQTFYPLLDSSLARVRQEDVDPYTLSLVTEALT